MTVRILLILMLLAGTAHADVAPPGLIAGLGIALVVAVIAIVGGIWLAWRAWRRKR